MGSAEEGVKQFLIRFHAIRLKHRERPVKVRSKSLKNHVFRRVQAVLWQGLSSGKKKQHKHKLFGPDFLRTFLTLTPECPGVKSFSPSSGPQENALFGADVHDFRRGRP